MKFQILNNTYSLHSHANITLRQFIALQNATMPSEIVQIYTGLDKNTILSAEFDGINRMAARIVEILNSEPKDLGVGRITIDNETFELPTWREVYGQIHTNLTMGQFVNMTLLNNAIRGVEKGDIKKLPLLLASIYTKPNENLSEEKILQRAELFLDATLEQVYSGFFLQIRRQTVFMKLLSFYLKTVLAFIKLTKKLRLYKEKFKQILTKTGLPIGKHTSSH